ncbi:MAG: DUF2520 domain-containing protein [Bacteroidetes bacterium]|nr:DUF2520 domain-containing protein [Bacteroidota bacterium]
MMAQLKIVLIGSGNVATQLGTALKKCGCNIVQVYSQNQKHAAALSRKLKSSYTAAIENLVQTADIYIVAVKDDALSSVLAQINFQPNLIVHTSGTTSLAVFKPKFKNYGVFYPLQTFSKNNIIIFNEVPFFIEASHRKAYQQIESTARLLSQKVYSSNSEKRKALHVAAVFACNFTNHMYAIANEILIRENIPFEVLLPLIQETANKVKTAPPKLMQTGPAVRNDKVVITAHKKYLQDSVDYKKIYTLVSQSISDFTK